LSLRTGLSIEMQKKSPSLTKGDVNVHIYADLFHHSATPAALFDTNKKCILANHSFLVQLGYPAANHSHLNPDFLQIFEDKAQGTAFFEQLCERKIVRRHESHLITKNGHGFSVLISGRVFNFNGDKFFQISFTDISRLKDLEETIRKDSAKIVSIMENSAAGLFYVSPEGILTNLNMKLLKMLDINENAYIGQPVKIWLGDLLAKTSEPEIIQKRIATALSDLDQYPKIEFAITAGITFHYEMALFPVKGEMGESLGWGAIVQDITELKQQANWKLELLSILSHDIRSPLATLKGHMSMLQENLTHWGDDIVKDFLNTISENIDKLSYQIDRNLALTRVEGGDLGLRPQNIDLVQCVEQAIKFISDKKDKLVIDLIHDDNLAKTRADPARIEEVMINLLDNAVRYNPPDKNLIIEIHSSGSWLIVSVRDFGKGVPADKQKTIFDKYVRVDEEGTGTGLGLYISRKIVEAHGGQIRIQSPLPNMKHGTEFTFTLPATYSAPTKRTPLVKRQSLNRTANKEFTILVIEDELDQLTLMKTILDEAGFQVETVTNGVSALDVVKISPPDLILLDWLLPGMNGLAVCQGIRRYTNAPIIVVTSCTEQEELLTAFDAGADDYIIKPFDRQELFARIHALLRRESAIQNPVKSNRFNAHGLVIDFDTHETWLDGENLLLPRAEYEILEYMAQHRNQLLTYGQIIESVNSLMVEDSQNALYVHISRLRKKIEPDLKNPTFIITRWGIGYVFMPY
jgi:PAS domain S-box-containing protein